MEDAKLKRMCNILGVSGQSGANNNVRSVALKFMMSAMKQARAPVKCWFQAARIFDDAIAAEEALAGAKATQMQQPQVPVERLLTSAVAAWVIALKYEDADVTVAPAGKKYQLDALIPSASRLSEQFGGQPITKEAVLAKERALFFASARDVCLPTPDQWFMLLTRRFEAITQGVLGEEVVNAATSWATWVAMAGICRAPLSAEDRMQKMIVGTFGLLLIATGLVSPEKLMPSHVDPSQWSRPLQWSLTELQAVVSKLQEKTLTPIEPKGRNGVPLFAVEFATGVPIQEVRENVLLATNLVHATRMHAELACIWQRQMQQWEQQQAFQWDG
jgi:hypothetical protein